MIILDERKYAEECLESGELDKKPAITLHILAKYLYHIKGFRKRKIYLFLIEYIENNYPRYSKSKSSWNKSIEKIATKAGKFPLYETPEIWITENELRAIDEVQLSKNHKTIAFTLLCLAKLRNLRNPKNNGWVNNSSSEIFKLAHIATTSSRQEEILGDLLIHGLIEAAKKIDNLSNRVTFIDNNSKKILQVDDFRELGYKYLQYIGENIISCQNCGVLIRGNKHNTRKYCSGCVCGESKEWKTVRCIDCGTSFNVHPKNNRTHRCAECQKKYRAKYQKTLMRTKRAGNVGTTNQKPT